MDTYTQFALDTAQKTGEALMKHFLKGEPRTRGNPKEIKTRYDLIADEIIKKEIERTFPEHSYLTEETGMVEKDSDFLWVVDPLDGTGNFINGNQFFAVSIALWIKGIPQVGVMEAPALKERYIAVKGKGAYMVDLNRGRKKTACVSTAKDIPKAYIVYCEGGSTDKKRALKFIKQLYPEVKDMRKLGSAALELAWVGLGRADAYITPLISLWDIAAGMLFVKEAGGRILDFDLKPWRFPDMLKKDRVNVLATNKKLRMPPITF